MNKDELIKQIRELENFWEITPKEDMFGVGWNHAKAEIVKMIEKETNDGNFVRRFVQANNDLIHQLNPKNGY